MRKFSLLEFEKTKSEFGVIILSDGTVIDAEGDYLSTLLTIISDKYSLPLDMVVDMCPHSTPMQIILWLCVTADAICVNSTGILMHAISESQLDAIIRLKDEGIYIGEVPYSKCN